MNKKMLINGKFVEGNGEPLNDINPSTDNLITSFSTASEEDIRATIDSAELAQERWATLPAIDRANYLRKISKKIRESIKQLSMIITEEEGKTLKFSEREVNNAANYIDYMAEWARRVEGEIIQSDIPDENIFLYREPIGVVAAIIPWNSPFFIFARKMAPALMAGNTIVIKPSSETPNSAYEFSKIVMEAKIPNGVVNVVYGDGRKVGRTLTGNKKIGFVTFTGSTEAGIEIMHNVSNNVTKVSLELGGNAPAIVMEDADLENASISILQSRMFNNGQVCNAAERVYVHERVSNDFIGIVNKLMKKMKVGDPMAHDIDNGPLINKTAQERIFRLVSSTRDEGGKVITGGEKININGKGSFFEPTLISGVTHEHHIMKKEIFGPVLPVATFKNTDEAIEYANDSEAGLTSSVYTSNLNTAMKLVNSLKFGETYVNRPNGETMQGYHAGWRKSGIGGDDGKHGFWEYFNTHVVYIRYNL